MNVGANFMRVAMSCAQDASSMTLKLAPQQGQYKPWFQNVDVVFYGATRATSSQGAKYDEASHSVRLTVPYKSMGQEVRVTF